jgi:hypothetical protein
LEHLAIPPVDKKSLKYNAWKTREWRRKNPSRAKELDRANYLRNRRKIIARATVATRRWRDANRELNRERTRAHSHGMSVLQLRDLYARQNNRCAICHILEGTEKFHIDHDHATGHIRGLICRDHNVGLTENTTPAMLRAMADYLERGGL